MANKRRPKKTKAPYKCYGPNGLVKRVAVSASTGGIRMNEEDEGESEEEEVEMSVLAGGPRGKARGKARSQEEDQDQDHPQGRAAAVRAAARVGVAVGAISTKVDGMVEIPVEFSVVEPVYTQQHNQHNNQHNQDVLPVEIYQLVMLFTQGKKLDYLFVSKLFYQLYLPMLYHDPKLDSYNFYHFVESLAARKSQLGSLVNRLDLSLIIQSGKNSYVSKLLRRCSPSLETFVAPQTSFGIAPLISLRACKNIRILDLGLVSETVNLNQLFHAIKNAKYLTHLSFPRSSISCEDYDDSYWPPNLQCLRLSGGITDEFVTDSVFPQTITTLEFAHCPILKDFAIYNMLSKFGESLRSLSFHYPMPGLTESSMDFIFTYCPNLLFLQITVDYCSRFLFGEELLPLLHTMDRPLKTLWIESSGGLGQSYKIHPDDLTIAMMEDRLPNLKNVRVTPKLGWDFNSDDVAVLVDLLEENGGGLYVSDR